MWHISRANDKKWAEFQQDSRIQAQPYGGLSRMEIIAQIWFVPRVKLCQFLQVAWMANESAQDASTTASGYSNSPELKAVSSTQHCMPNTKSMLPSTRPSVLNLLIQSSQQCTQNPNFNNKQQGENAVIAKDGFSDDLDEDLDSFLRLMTSGWRSGGRWSVLWGVDDFWGSYLATLKPQLQTTNKKHCKSTTQTSCNKPLWNGQSASGVCSALSTQKAGR